jgi:hypothetical protein
LIVLIANAHPLLVWLSLSFSLALEGQTKPDQHHSYLLQLQQIQMPSTCSIQSSYEGTPVHFEVIS